MFWVTAFWVLTGLLALVYVGYPMILYLLALAHRLGAGNESRDPETWPSVTVLVPAYNEEAVIEAKVRNLLALDYPTDLLTALVVSDGSSDDTCSRARGVLEASPPEARGRVRVIERPGRSGKSAALSEAVREAPGEILVFTDANTLYRPDAVRRLAARFSDPRVGLVSGRLEYQEDPDAQAGGEGLYWRYENAVKKWEGELGSLLVANGSIYAMRKELFEPIPGPVADDLFIPLVVAGRGARLVYEAGAVAEERLPTHAGEDFRSKARIVTQGFEGIRRFGGRIVRCGPMRTVQYLLHKVLRWLVGLALVGLLLVSVAGREHPTLFAALLLQAGFYALAVAGFLARRRPSVPAVLRIPFYFCLVNAAALKGLIDFLVGEQRTVWEKSESTRR